MLRAVIVVCCMCLACACAEPPSKEMGQAQGAIDAARAAGAEQYAPAELQAAVEALAQAEVAVTARDYRLALAMALDGRERAQNAAKAAVDGRARARGDAERELAEAVALVDRAEARLKGPESTRVPRRTAAAVERSIGSARTSLQEARALLEKEDYAAVTKTATAVAAEIERALATLGGAPSPAPRSKTR